MQFFDYDRFWENTDGYADSVIAKRQQVERQIRSDDPGLTSLEIGENDHCPSRFLVDEDEDEDEDAGDLWESLGADIARNTHLTFLRVRYFPYPEYLVRLFRGIAGNQSIQKLFIFGSPFSDTFVSTLVSFLKGNGSLELLDLHLDHGDGESEHIVQLSSALREFSTLKKLCLQYDFHLEDTEFQQLLQALSGHSDFGGLSLRNCRVECSHCVALAALPPKLTELSLGMNRFGDDGIKLISEFLAANSTLKELALDSNSHVTAIGWSAFVDSLSSVLQKSSCSLERMDLSCIREIDDDIVIRLAKALTGNTSLKELNLRGCRGVSRNGWSTFAHVLASSPCALEKLVLDENLFNGGSVMSLGHFLTSDNNSLKTLNLSHNSDVSAGGWGDIVRVLSSPKSVLEDLDLSSNTMNDNALDALAQALARNPALKRIGLCGIEGVAPRGWTAFMRALTAGNFALESLDLCYNNELNDEALLLLADGLVGNPQKLKHLDLHGNGNITSNGWTTFFERLSPALSDARCSLGTLLLDENSIGDSVVGVLANAMARNASLKEVHLDENEDISSRGWEAFAGILGSTSSIDGTYLSNHTLETLLTTGIECQFPEGVRSLLLLNRGRTKSEAARLKIIEIHFRDGFVAQPFVSMELEVLPHALAWMARDGRELGRCWSFLKSMPLLFGAGSDGKKSKREG